MKGRIQIYAGYARSHKKCLEAGASRSKHFTARVDHEVLGGAPGDGQFNTPLATLHIWNGWADKFLTTPENGLSDTYFSLEGKYKRFGMNGVFHLFQSDTGNMDYGNEMDLLFTYTSPWQQLFGFKAAFYGADLYSQDTDKIMLYTV